MYCVLHETKICIHIYNYYIYMHFIHIPLDFHGEKEILTSNLYTFYIFFFPLNLRLLYIICTILIVVPESVFSK